MRALLPLAQGRKAQPSAAILDSRTLQSTPESGARAGFDGAKRKKDSKVQIGVDTLGQLLALHVTAADEQDRAQVAARFRRLARDYERLPETIAGLHFLAFAILMLKRVVAILSQIS